MSELTRRGFLGASSCALLAAKHFTEIPSHYFDFTTYPKPTTTDPRFIGKLTWGYHNKLIVNGKEIPNSVRVTRFVTGPDGWYEFHLTDADGFKIQANGDVIRATERGDIRFVVDAPD